MISRTGQLAPRFLYHLALLLMAGLVCCGTPRAGAEQNFADPDISIESARDALKGSPRIPWYDTETDDFRAAEVEPQRPPKRQSTMSLSIMQFLMWLGWIVLIVLLMMIVYLLMKRYLNREVASGIEAERTAVGADIVRVEELPVSLGKSPADYLDEAQRLYNKGDLAQAIVYLFSHQLLQLDRRHWLRLVKGKTNRQYLREIRRQGTAEAEQLSVMFNSTVLLFEEVFFGKRLPPQDRIEQVWHDIDRFESLVLTKEPTTA